jgi:CRP-like cAMP-binding protein
MKHDCVKPLCDSLLTTMEQDYTISAGQTIIEQGERGSGFFILKSGTLEVFKDDVLLAVLMYPGTIFGEMGDILGRPRSCTVKAKNNAVITHIQTESLEQMVRENPEIASKIIRTLASRLERTTQKLVDTARDNPLWSAKP